MVFLIRYVYYRRPALNTNYLTDYYLFYCVTTFGKMTNCKSMKIKMFKQKSTKNYYHLLTPSMGTAAGLVILLLPTRPLTQRPLTIVYNFQANQRRHQLHRPMQPIPPMLPPLGGKIVQSWTHLAVHPLTDNCSSHCLYIWNGQDGVLFTQSSYYSIRESTSCMKNKLFCL